MKSIQTFLGALFCLFFAACASTSSHPLDQVKEDVWLSLEGSNRHPVLSDDDQLVAFESRNREDHSSSQIYVYSFLTKAERRINFNRADNYLGEILSSPKKTILFASSFDEILESQTRSREQLDRIPSLDIYTTNIDGSKLTRLMKFPGYDGSPTLNNSGDWLAFVSRRDRGEDLFILNLKTKKTLKLTASPELAQVPRFSRKKNNLAYLVKTKTANAEADLYKVFLSEPPFKQKTLLFESTEPLWNLQWLGDGNLLVVKSKTLTDPTDLEVWDVTKKQRISEAKTKITSRDVTVTSNLKIAIFSDKHVIESDSKSPAQNQLGLTPIQFSQTPPSH